MERQTNRGETARQQPSPPERWKTGNEPMTSAQAGYLETLCREANEPFDTSLTKAQASKKIQELKNKTGRPQ